MCFQYQHLCKFTNSNCFKYQDIFATVFWMASSTMCQCSNQDKSLWLFWENCYNSKRFFQWMRPFLLISSPNYLHFKSLSVLYCNFTENVGRNRRSNDGRLEINKFEICFFIFILSALPFTAVEAKS